MRIDNVTGSCLLAIVTLPLAVGAMVYTGDQVWMVIWSAVSLLRLGWLVAKDVL